MRLDTTNKYHYDIMAATRGPDAEGCFADKCKSLFTARIRYWVGCTESCAGFVRSQGTNDGLILRVLNNTPKEIPDWWPHYGSHVRSALRALLKVSPKSLQGFSPSEAKQLIDVLDKTHAKFYDEDELPF